MKPMLKAIAISLLALAGCDGNIKPSIKPTIESMIATGTEQETFDCVDGRVSRECEILTKDQLESGKWHHAELSISRDGKVSLKIGRLFYFVDDASTSFIGGTQLATMKMKSISKQTAKVTLYVENSGSRIQVEAFTGEGKRFIDTLTDF